MRTLHELVPPFLQNNADFQAHMAAVAASDALHHSPPPQDQSKHTDIASLLVTTLSNSALAPKEPQSAVTLSPSQTSSRAASASQPQTPAPPESATSMTPALEGVARVTQQAQMAIRSILANANAQQKPETIVWNMNNVTVPPP